MKIRFLAALLLAALALSLFTGCAADTLRRLDAAEEVIDDRLDMAEDALESRIDTMITESPIPNSPAPVPQTEPAPASQSSAVITKEEAEKIALEHAGFTADQVQRLRTGLDYDRGKPEYEVDFHVDRWEYDYELDAETGKIISFDKDFDD